VRKRRSRVEVEQLVAEYHASGLTRDSFCQQHDVSVAALDKYRQRVLKWARQGAGPMLPVEVIPSTAEGSSCARGSSALVVQSGSGHGIEVGRGFDGETLHRLLAILDRI
jgi:hypothetical protein